MLSFLLLFGSAVAGYVVVSSALDTAKEVAETIQGGGVSLNMEAITQLVEEQARANGKSTNVATMAFFAFWLIGIVDSIRVGRKLEKVENVAREKET